MTVSLYPLKQCFSNPGHRTTRGQQRFARRSAGGFGGKSIAKIVSETERMKNTPIHTSVLKLPLLADLQQKVGESVLATSSLTAIIILDNASN
jgi:hypothetical protein